MARKLGELLVAGKVLEPEDLKKALDAQLIFGGRLGTNLLELGLLDENTLSRVLKEQRRVEVATPEIMDKAAPEALRMVPAKVADRHKVIPLGLDGKKLKVAMVDPTDLIVLDELAFMTGCTVIPYIAPEVRLVAYLDKYYEIPRPLRYIRLSHSDEGGAAGLDDSALAAAFTDGVQDQAPGGASADGTTASQLHAAAAVRPSTPEQLAPQKEPLLSINDLLGVDAGTSVTPQTLRAVQEASPEGQAQVDAAVEEMKRRREEEAENAAAAEQRSTTFAEAAAMLAHAETREDIGDALVAFASGQFKRVAAYIVQKERALGWHVRLPGVAEDRARAAARAVVVPLDQPSVLEGVATSGQYYMGELPARHGDELLASAVGAPRPLNVVILPVKLDDHVIMAMYGDNGDQQLGSFDMRALRAVCTKASQAMEVMLLRSKIRRDL